MALLKPFQLAIVCDILAAYQYDQPFHHYFAALAKQHRNWGSKDRKTYRNACYAYFRLGFITTSGDLESNVLKALNYQENAKDLVDLETIFPFKDVVSDQIDFSEWVKSHLFQKPVYLMMRKNFEEDCIRFLQQNNIPFESSFSNGLRVPADSKCDELIENGKAWMMDLASAKAADAVALMPGNLVWDACSGAGGKALFLTQKYEDQIQITCSDKRFTVLENLKSRFVRLKLNLPKIELVDLMAPSHLPVKYDAIVLDVPCSGSGTWGRTPEQIRNFDRMMPLNYASIQRKIVSNAVKSLKPGGHLIYITCSVFKEENEKTVDYIQENLGLNCLGMGYYFDQHHTSDTLFLATFKSN